MINLQEDVKKKVFMKVHDICNNRKLHSSDAILKGCFNNNFYNQDNHKKLEIDSLISAFQTYFMDSF